MRDLLEQQALDALRSDLRQNVKRHESLHGANADLISTSRLFPLRVLSEFDSGSHEGSLGRSLRELAFALSLARHDWVRNRVSSADCCALFRSRVVKRQAALHRVQFSCMEISR